MLDVVVVGAGPAGSRAAYRLALMGHDVAVLEKRSSAGLKTCCTGIISQECFSKYNIPLEVVHRQVRTAKLFSPSGYSLRIVRPDFQAYVVNRSAFDIHLAGLALNQGVSYSFNTSVEYIDVKSDRVALSVTSKGKSFTIDARTGILACGFNTPVVRKAGFKQSRFFAVGAQVEVEAGGLEEIEIYFGRRIAPGFYSWLVPTHNSRALAGLISSSSAGLHLRKWLADLSEKGKIIAKDPKIGYHGIPMYPLPKTYHDRLLVVGDAAGQVKPTTGGGIYFGLLCADIAAETLHKGSLSGNLSAEYLSLYQREWQKILMQELRTEYLARRFYPCLSDARIDRIFAYAVSDGWVDRIMANKHVAFDWHGRALYGMIRTGFWSVLFRKMGWFFNKKNSE